MNPVIDFYNVHQGFCNLAMALLVFGGLARIAFWSDCHGMRISGPLALGLGCMLALALIVWADENGRRIQDLGWWAALVLVQAIFLLLFNSGWKSREM